MNLRRLFSQLSIAAVAIIASVGIQAFAFTEPTTAPPQANAYAPINTGPSAQYKSGGLLLNVGSHPAATGLAVPNGNVGIGTSAAPTSKLQVDSGAIGGTTAFLPDYVNWGAYGVGAGGAAIYNDNNGYKALMIVGNNSADGHTRVVKLFDNLDVNGNANVGGNITANNVCTSGGKCLSSVGGATALTSYNQLPPGATAGHCETHSTTSGGLATCSGAVAPSVCTGASSSICGCAAGFSPEITGANGPYQCELGSAYCTDTYYTCSKN